MWQKHKELDDETWIGPGNDGHVEGQAAGATLVITGWGCASTKYKGAQSRAENVERWLNNLTTLW